MTDRRIKELRLQLGLSQERFARLLGVSLQTVRRWEAGLSRPLPIIDARLEQLQEELRKETSNNVPQIASTQTGDGSWQSGEMVEIGIGGVFKGIGSLLDLFSKMIDEGREEHVGLGNVSMLGGKARGIYGISLKVGIGGKPVIEQFGNIKATERGTEVAEVRQPLVDVLDEGERLVVIAELPGIENDEIRIELKGDILIVCAEGKYRKYGKEILLPCAVDPSGIKSSYNNGILTIELTKERLS